MADDRWVEVTPSPFPHEAAGLKIVRELLPTRAPYRAWTNFEFRDDRGNWSECDLMILAPDGLHLIELKFYSGRLRGNDQVWLRDGHAPEDSPLRLANSKAKRLRSKLMSAYDEFVRGKKFSSPPPRAREAIPFIHAAVFLHHPDLRCELRDASRRDLYGLTEHAASGLDPITDVLAGTPQPGRPIYESAVVGAMQLIGLRARSREAGQFVLDQQALDDGPGWQDWLGTHKLVSSRRARIRFQVAPEGSSEEHRRTLRRLAEHELTVMHQLSHDAILRPEDFVDSELGPGLVYPYDPSWQRLDLWLAGLGQPLAFDAQLGLIRQIAEGLAYAHGRGVVHRGLGPRAVQVRAARDGRLQVRLTDWQGVGRTDASASAAATRGVTALLQSDGETDSDGERWFRDGFVAPEGVLGDAQGRLRLDVFSLGALAFYLVTGGEPPARTTTDLRARLHDQGGLDVSVELPAAPPPLRLAILEATRPQVSERLPDVAAFLRAIDDVARPTTEGPSDPLDATSGAILGGRFKLLRRLGAGSTAVGLLVDDPQNPSSQGHVLKVALDDAAARRLADEADALEQLSSPRIVKLVEGPFGIDGRRALLLASAGSETLATYLGNRERLSLDLLERWGADLLEAVVALDAAGVQHRDIKPTNLGVREDRSNKTNRAKHLVLFDFSLTKAPATDTQAGTRPYLDPFLTKRRPFDSAAERYAAAVVLFEMATGHTPRFGDGLSDPAAIHDEASIDPAEFDPSASAKLAAFFMTALARDAGTRHHTAAQMLLQWRACFPDSSVVPADADELAANATATTPLAESGLSPRAISALEQLKVTTVGELARVDSLLLTRLQGAVRPSRLEVAARAKQWRSMFGRPRGGWVVESTDTGWPDPHEAADLLLAGVRVGKADTAVVLAAQLLGVAGAVDANATQVELGAGMRPQVGRARISQLLATLQERWAADPASLDLLKRTTAAADARLTALGGVATFDELSRHLVSLLVTGRPSVGERRLVEGLLRCTLDRQAAVERADGLDADGESWSVRRREGRPLLIATRPDLLDVAESLGRRADALVSEANATGTDALVPAARVADRLAAVLDEVEASAPARAQTPYGALRDPRRLARLAARLSTHAGASANGELHHRHLSAGAALREALPAVSPGQRHEPDALRTRVRARFPQASELPQRPGLDAVVAEAGVGLAWHEEQRAYVALAAAPRETTGAVPHEPTHIPLTAGAQGPGPVGQRLLDSRDARSFVALGVGAQRLERFISLLRERYGAVELDLTHALMDALHATAATVGIPWSDVLSADAETPGSRAHSGLRALVQRSLPAVASAIETTVRNAEGRPVVLTDPSLLARFDGLRLLTPWLDLSFARPVAVWLVVPQLHGNTGAAVDGRPLPLTAPGQYVAVPAEWIDTHAREGSTA